MKLKIKLKQAEYDMRFEGNSMTVEVTFAGEDKQGLPKKITSTLGYYGPAQVELAVNRIIREELTLHEEQVNLREFLKVYKGIQEIINPQLADLAQAIKEHRLETN